MFNHIEPQKGSLLISEPYISDNNFNRAVILLCDHNDNETLGFVVNHPICNTVGSIISEIKDCSFPLYMGGPVGQNEIFFIHKRFDLLFSGEEIIPGIFFGGDAVRLFELINSQQIMEDEVKFFVGYSGWGSGQLLKEMEQNTWAVQKNILPDIIFDKKSDQIWKQAIISLGKKYAHVANFPSSPDLN